MRKILNNSELKKISGMLWMPVRTKPRCEKKLATYCEGNNIPYYLPLIKSAKRQKRQNLVFYLPMFSGYIFCALNDNLFRQIVNSNSVIHKLKTDELSESLLLEELCAIKKLEEKSDQLEIIVKPEIIEGKKIKINGGPFASFSGIVVKRKNKALVAVNLELLGQSVSAEIDIEFLEIEED